MLPGGFSFLPVFPVIQVDSVIVADSVIVVDLVIPCDAAQLISVRVHSKVSGF